MPRLLRSSPMHHHFSNKSNVMPDCGSKKSSAPAPLSPFLYTSTATPFIYCSCHFNKLFKLTALSVERGTHLEDPRRKAKGDGSSSCSQIQHVFPINGERYSILRAVGYLSCTFSDPGDRDGLSHAVHDVYAVSTSNIRAKTDRYSEV